MYLTIYKLHIENPSVCRAALDAAEMHRQVQWMFNAARQDHDVLYRIDQGYLLVQSDIQPSRQGIFEQVGQSDMTKKMDSWQDGDTIRFRIRTVPRYSVKGAKHYLKTEPDRITWLKRQFEKHGMQVRSVHEKGKHTMTVSSKINRVTGGATVFTAWEYEGAFDVSDKNAFIHAYAHGIGSQKAYGCGMICLCG